MITQGHERITISRLPDWRWWVWIDEPLNRYFPKHAGRITATPGRFLYARGGRCPTETGCLDAIADAVDEARSELAEFVRRPTHALGPAGQLIPLGDDVIALDEPLLTIGSGR